MEKKNIYYLIAGVAVVLVLLFAMTRGDEIKLEGVTQGSEYNATSTAASGVYGAFAGDKLLKTGWGIFGSVIVTGANTGIVNFYNATTSDATLRATATSSILIASMPASLAAGTYVFDSVFTTGLLVELESGNMPTTTITWR